MTDNRDDYIEDENVYGDLFNEAGERETDREAEFLFVGALLRRPHLVTDDLRALVEPNLFFDRALGRVYGGLLNLGGFDPEPGQAADWLGGADVMGRTGTQAIGYLIALGDEVSAPQVEALADRIADAGVRRLEAAPTAPVLDHEWQSTMGLLMWEDRNSFVQVEYDYLVEDTIPERELTIIMGATQAGKSFLAFHLAMCMARAQPFFGKQIAEPVPVVWCAFEGGRGARGRMLAYAKHHNIGQDNILFAALTNPVDLWSNELNIGQLIKEVEGVVRTRFNGRRPGALFIDTHNAATPGASEIDSEAVSKIRDRYKQLMHAIGCAIIIIGHTNAMGKHRGNELLVNNVDTVITVTKKSVLKNRTPVQLRDDDNREIRTVDLWKQREGETGHMFDFVLPAIETGIKNKFGKSRTSCVVVSPNWSAQAEAEANVKGEKETRQGIKLSDHEDYFFKVLWKALTEIGEPAPPALNLPLNRLVVHRANVSDRYKRGLIPDDAAGAVSNNTIKSRWQRATSRLRKLGVIGFEEPYFYWTGKPVMGVPGTMPQRQLFDEMSTAMPTDFPEFPDDTDMKDFG